MNQNAAQTSDKRVRIGVIGAGISGITAAWLLSRRYEVTLIEKEARLGGHAHTHRLESGPDSKTPIDMGFIVLNDRNYPILMKLFEQWGVQIKDSDMGFGFEDKATGFYYSSDVPRGLFARRKNIISPCFWRIIIDIFRFNRIACQTLQAGLGRLTLGEFLEKYGFSKAYIDYHITPISAAVWSTPAQDILDFPAESILRFYDNHGFLKLTDRPRWKTVVGGSIAYVDAFEKQFRGTVKKNCPILQVRRSADSIHVTCEDRTQMEFDYIVLATHADTSLQLLSNPDPNEFRILSQWKYIKNQVTLHTDRCVMPPRRSAWASWSYLRMSENHASPVMTMSYYMNRLQRLEATLDYFVTLNGEDLIDPQQGIKSVVFDHPCYTFDALGTHRELDAINGNHRIFYCGAYCGYGFHEDGARSGLTAARKLGVEL
ncbi:MAG TPA: FAD-dependent oxidoreductase [Anaerohalosphaeraceae bacterium]|nr:FAD-dependent oxidoreductase [Anaerohalosphaeraceae bacterium]